jgi:cytochrome c-type biogenesis protein CcmH/NrfG
MAQAVNESTTNSNWTSTQAYVLAVICLLVGVAAGYLLRGSGSTTPGAESATVATAPAAGAMPGGMPGAGMGNQQPSPEQLKQMADAQAAPLLEQLKSKPNDPALLANIGNLYYDAQQYKDAIGYYTKSLASDPKDANVRTDMATAYAYAGDADRAISEFNTALKYDPKHGQTMFNLGMIEWQGKGDMKAAVDTWEKLLKVVPDYPDRAKVEQLIAKAKEHTTMAPGTMTDKPAKM